LINALSGLTYRTSYPLEDAESIFEIIGKKAASVLPPAVDALMMTSQSLLNTTGIELSWISRKDVQPCFHIHLCMDSWSNSKEEELRLI
jgi:hypothetical protein